MSHLPAAGGLLGASRQPSHCHLSGLKGCGWHSRQRGGQRDGWPGAVNGESVGRHSLVDVHVLVSFMS